MKENITDSNDLFYAAGKEYAAGPLKLAYASEYMQETRKFVFSEGMNESAVLANFVSMTGKNDNPIEFIEKWIPRLIEYQGKPCTLEQLYTHGWTIADLNKLFKQVLCISC